MAWDNPNTPAKWGVTLADFDKGGWGTAVGSFKVPASTIKRFRKDIKDPITNAITGNEFDVERAFNEIAQTYINGVVSLYKILRKTFFYWYPDKTQTLLRQAIYNAIEFSCLNKQLWQNINGSSISTPGFNVTVDNTSWLITSDMMGLKAWNLLNNSEIETYKKVSQGRVSAYTASTNGNFEVIGKWDDNKIPDLN